MTRVEVTPGVENTDDRLVTVIVVGPTHPFETRAMSERAKVIGLEPPCASQFVRGAAILVGGWRSHVLFERSAKGQSSIGIRRLGSSRNDSPGERGVRFFNACG